MSDPRPRKVRAVAFGWGWGLTAALVGGQARAAPDPVPAGPGDTSAVGPIAVTADGCGTLQASEVARLLQLELRSVTDEIRDGPPLEVALRCSDDRLAIAITDPLTRKRIERNIPPLADQPGRERVAALAVSQLFSASWLELLLPLPPAQAEPVEPPAPAAALRAAKQVAVEQATPPRAYEILVGAGVRGRSLESGEPFPASRLDAMVRAWFSPSVAIVAQAGWDFGQAVRGAGQVRAHAIGASAGLGWRFSPGQIAGIGGHIMVGAAYARVRGRPGRTDDAFGASTQGATGELMAGIGPRIRAGRFRLDLDLETGAMLRTPEALVQTRNREGTIVSDEPVTLGGLWVGAVLRLGADLTRPRARR